MAISTGGGDDLVSEINVTPFVDVMLVLLIIFMVTAPMMIGLDVDLPPVQTSEMLPAENDHMILTIKDDGSLFLDEYPTSMNDLPSVLKV